MVTIFTGMKMASHPVGQEARMTITGCLTPGRVISYWALRL